MTRLLGILILIGLLVIWPAIMLLSAVQDVERVMGA